LQSLGQLEGGTAGTCLIPLLPLRLYFAWVTLATTVPFSPWRNWSPWSSTGRNPKHTWQSHATRSRSVSLELPWQQGGPAPRELVLCSATLDAAILPAGTPRHGLSDADYGHPVAQQKVGRTKPLTTATAGSNSCSPAAPRRPWR
jgi:hypothetical protein